MASYARRFVQKGVRLVGGCCGTTPAHIRQIKSAVRLLSPGPGPRRAWRPWRRRPRRPGIPSAAAPVPREQKSRLAHELARGAFVVLAELEPPRGHDCATLIDRARTLKIRGVDAINVPDTPRVRASTSALATAVLIEQRAGVETLLHYTCRDRNLLGMQSDLLGAHAMGLRNLLITTGDPPIVGDYPQATGVFDVDSIGLANVVTRLNHGLDVGGASVGAPTSFHLGVAVNPTALDIELEVQRFAYKAEAGAEFAVTQAVFDVDVLQAFLAQDRAVTACRSSPGSGCSSRCATPSTWRTRCPACACRPALVDRMRRADEAGARRGRGHRHRARTGGRRAAARERRADWNGRPPVLVYPRCARGHRMKRDPDSQFGVARAPGVSRRADAEPAVGRRHRAEFGPARPEGLAARDAGLPRRSNSGPGTGVVTRELLARTGESGTLLAVDTDRTFVERIRRAWPEVDCVCASAETLPVLAAERGWADVDHIVSGLPFADAACRDDAADPRRRAAACCGVGGTFTTFQYVHAYPPAAGGGLPPRAERAASAASPRRSSWSRNVPPALVLTWRRLAH